MNLTFTAIALIILISMEGVALYTLSRRPERDRHVIEVHTLLLLTALVILFESYLVGGAVMIGITAYWLYRSSDKRTIQP